MAAASGINNAARYKWRLLSLLNSSNANSDCSPWESENITAVPIREIAIVMGVNKAADRAAFCCVLFGLAWIKFTQNKLDIKINVVKSDIAITAQAKFLNRH